MDAIVQKKKQELVKQGYTFTFQPFASGGNTSKPTYRRAPTGLNNSQHMLPPKPSQSSLKISFNRGRGALPGLMETLQVTNNILPQGGNQSPTVQQQQLSGTK